MCVVFVLTNERTKFLLIRRTNSNIIIGRNLHLLFAFLFILNRNNRFWTDFRNVFFYMWLRMRTKRALCTVCHLPIPISQHMFRHFSSAALNSQLGFCVRLYVRRCRAAPKTVMRMFVAVRSLTLTIR